MKIKFQSKIILFIFSIVFFGVMAVALYAYPSGPNDLRTQVCRQENYSTTQANFVTGCIGSYPAACGANGDLVGCRDNFSENISYTRSRYAGIQINNSNKTISNCASVGDVFLCYESWYVETSGSSPTSGRCYTAVDAEGGANYTNVTTACPGAVVRPGMTCTNVTALEPWSCGTFFGTSAKGAMARMQLGRTATGNTNVDKYVVDVLFFNVTYTHTSTTPNVSLISPADGNYNFSGNITFSCNATSSGTLANITLYSNYSGVFSPNITNIVSGSFNQTTLNMTNLVDRVIGWNCYACSSTGDCSFASSNFTLFVDVSIPGINFTSPTENHGSFVSRRNILVNVSVNDTSLRNVTINIYNSTRDLINSSNSSLLSPFYYNFSVSADSVYYFNATVYDLAGNLNSTETRNVTVDKVNPNINFSTPIPAAGSIRTYGNIAINVTANDTYLKNVTIYLYNLSGLVNSSNSLTSPLYINFTGLADNLYFYNATAYDLAENLNSTETRNVTIDRVPPTINFTNPTETSGIYVSRSNIVVNVTATDSVSGLKNITIYFYNSTDFVNSTNSSLSQFYFNLTGLPDEIYYFNSTAYDLAGNFNSTSTRNITLDTTIPLVAFGTGTLGDGANVSQSSVYVNVSVTEINEANITFRIFNSTGNFNTTTFSAGTRFVNFTGLPEGVYTYNVTVTDLALNVNTSLTRRITLDTHAPNGTLLAPSNGTYLNYSNANYTVNISDNLGIKNATLNIYNSTDLVNSSFVGFIAGTISATTGAVVTLTDNVYTWFYTIFDWAGNIFTTANNTVTIDTIYPSVFDLKPVAWTNFSIGSSVEIAANATDTNNISSVKAIITYPNSSSKTITLSISSGDKYNNSFVVPNLIDRYNITFVVNDSLGHVNDSESTFFIVNDTTLPIPVFIFPTPVNASTVGTNITSFNVTVSDNIAIDSCILELDGTNYSMSVVGSGTTATCNLTTAELSDKSWHNFTAWANDSYGNWNKTESRTYYINIDVPNVVFVSPTESSGSYLARTNILINASYNESDRVNITVRLYKASVLINSTTVTTASNYLNVTGLSDGIYYFNATSSDNLGREGYTETRTTTIDTINPTINLVSPTETSGIYVSRSNIVVNVTANDTNLKNITVDLYESHIIVTSATSATSPNFINFSDLPDGIYQFNATAYDLAGNSNYTATRNITLDTTIPLISFGTGTANNGTSYSLRNVYVNVSVTDINEANITFSLFNTTSLVNKTVFTSAIRTINFTDLTSGKYYYNVTVTDLAGNSNSTETRTVILSSNVPLISNITLSPNSTDGIDPGINLSFSATITTADLVSVSSVILSYYNGTAWANKTMVNNSGNIYTANITLISVPANYTYFIFANDSLGNANQTTNYTFESSWDCSWSVDSSIGAELGFNQNKNIGQINISNTGDIQYSTGNCSLDFRLSYDLAEGRVYFDSSYFKPSDKYTVAAKENRTILVNATFLSEVKTENTTISITDIGNISSSYNKSVSAVIITTTANQPYLYETIDSAPSSVALRSGDFSLSAYIRNLVGNGSSAVSAYNVSFNWSLPSSFIIKNGNATLNYSVMSDNSANYNQINISLNSTNLGSMTPGTYSVSVYALGYNSSGNLIKNINNETLLIKTSSIIFSCSNVTDGICVNACGYTLDPDCSAPPTPSPGGGGGGGSGGSGAIKSEVYSRSIEVVRGQEDSFEIDVENKYYNSTLQDLTLDVTGFLSKYVSISPSKIDKINAGENKKFIVKLKIPQYTENYEEYSLKIIVNGYRIEEGSSSKISYSQTQNIKLIIQEVSRQESSSTLSDAEKAVEEMKNAGFNVDEVSNLLSQAQSKLSGDRNKESQILSEKILAIKKKAFGTDELLRKVITVLNNPKKLGLLTGGSVSTGSFDRSTPLKELLDNMVKQRVVNVSADKNNTSKSLITGMLVTTQIETAINQKYPEIKQILQLSIAAFERGDYDTAEERANSAESLLLLQLKGNFILFVYFYWYFILLGFVIFSVAGIFGYRRFQKSYITKRIEDINKEEENIGTIIRDAQRNYFGGKISVGEYHGIMAQNQEKLAKIRKQRLTLRNRRINVLKPEEVNRDLKVEGSEVESEVKKLQEDFYRDRKISENEYKTQFQMNNERLAEIEGERTTLDLLNDKNKTKLNKGELEMQVEKAKGKNREGKLRKMFLVLSGILKRPFNYFGKKKEEKIKNKIVENKINVNADKDRDVKVVKLSDVLRKNSEKQINKKSSDNKKSGRIMSYIKNYKEKRKLKNEDHIREKIKDMGIK